MSGIKLIYKDLQDKNIAGLTSRLKVMIQSTSVNVLGLGSKSLENLSKYGMFYTVYLMLKH